jgi:hypothetical protein
MSARPSSEPSTLRVQAVFHELQSQKAEKIAAEMIARAHELANMPECECDVDVSVESIAPEQVASPPVENGAAARAPVTR